MRTVRWAVCPVGACQPTPDSSRCILSYRRRITTAYLFDTRRNLAAMNDDRLILAAEFDSSPQALAACGLLRSAGIPAALKRGIPGITQPNWAHVDNDALLLMVPISFLPQARALLDSRVPEQDFNAAAKRAGSLKSDP